MQRAWDDTCAGSGRIVLLAGEAGIGKSRLIEAFTAGLALEATSRLRYFCSEYHGKTPLYPIARQIERAADFGADDSPAIRLRKLEALLAENAPSGEELALMAELLALPANTLELTDVSELSPQRKREKTFSLLLRGVETLAARGPLLMLFEDAHWSDPTSIELLGRLVARLERMCVLVVVTFRPEFEAPWPEGHAVTAISLARLNEAQRKAFIAQVVGREDFDERMVASISERSDGIPLFIEELTRSIMEATADAAEVPVTLQSSLQARLDRLGTAAREIAQVGAAIGRQFTFSLLAAITRVDNKQLLAALDILEAAALLSCRGIPPNAVYTFRHALVQDAAYGTLLKGRRRDLHVVIARHLQGATSIAGANNELIAHHLTRAGRERDAIRAWKAAARQSVGQGAFAEAESQLRAGLGLVEKLSKSRETRQLELQLQNALGNVLIARRGYTATETLEAFGSARILAAELDDPGQGLRALWGLGTALLFAGRLGRVLEMMSEAAPLVERNGHLDARLAFSIVHGSVLLDMGRLVDGHRRLEETLAMDTEPGRDRERAILYGQSPRISALAHLSIASLLFDRADRSREQSDQSVREAQALSHKPMLCLAHSMACRRSWLAGESEALAYHTAVFEELAAEQATRLWLALAKTYTGWTLVDSGSLGDGIARIREGIEEYEASGARSGRPLLQLSLGRALSLARRDDQACEALTEALQEKDGGEEHWLKAQVLCELGGVRSRQNDAKGAEAALHRAISIARSQGADLFESRAKTALRQLALGHAMSGENSHGIAAESDSIG